MDHESRKLGPLLIGGIVTGLLGLAFGILVNLAQVDDSLTFFANVRWLPYVLGGLTIVLALVAIVQGQKLRRALKVFFLGAGAIALVPLFWYAVGVLVLLVVAYGAYEYFVED